jgi:hypothetical protein
MGLTENYIECYKRFYRYIISNEIIKDLNEQEFYLILQNNLRESLGKSKMSSNVCNAIIKTGKRKGEECGKPVKDGCEKCKTHSKKNEEDIVPSYISKAKEEEDILLIKKNNFNNFVYGNTGLIFKSSLEKYIVAKEGTNGQWLSLDEYDIELCKQYNLKYKIIQNKQRGEKTNKDLVNEHDVFRNTTPTERKKFQYIDVEEMVDDYINDNNEN